MSIEIIKKKLQLDIYGFSGTAINKDYEGAIFLLMKKLWKTVKSQDIKHKGLNIWVYEKNEKVFAGVELENPANQANELEQKSITLKKYAYYKHIGSYNLLKQVGENMRKELNNLGFETRLPYIEIYGHWINDETRLETELIMCLK